MFSKIILFFSLVFVCCSSCIKEDDVYYEVQYVVLPQEESQATFSVVYLDQSEASVSTGERGPERWYSPIIENMKKGSQARMEVTLLKGEPKMELRILKNGTLARSIIISDKNKPLSIETVI